MAHYGTLADHRFSDQADDIRGCTLYGVDGDKLGKIDDVIFDHGSGDIRYVVIDTGGWLRSKKFIVPADRVHVYDRDKDAYQVDLVRAHVERFPPYDEKSVHSERDWSDYEHRYRDAFHDSVVLHRTGSNRTITPETADMREVGAPGSVNEPPALRENTPPSGFGSLGEEIEPIEEPEGERESELKGDFTPHRLAGKFPDTAPSSRKIDMQPSVAREERVPQFYSVGNQNMPGQQDNPSERSGIGDVLDTSGEQRIAGLREGRIEGGAVHGAEGERPSSDVNRDRGERWGRFEDLLRRNRVDITAKCPSCGPAKDRAA